MHLFNKQVALITGATSGIGTAIALALAERGATLCLVGRRRDALESIADRAQTLGAFARGYCVDLARDDDVGEFAGLLRRDFETINILVHSAGSIGFGNLADAPVTELDNQFRDNVHAPYLLTQLMLPMLRACRGDIVFINSSIGLTTRPNVGQYSATQHALRALADTVRAEINGQGVRVLSVYPGRTATPRQAKIFAMEEREYRPEFLMQPGDVASVVVNALALNRTAEVTDIKIRPFIKFD